MTRRAGVLIAVLLSSCDPSGRQEGEDASAGRAEASAPAVSPTLTVRVAGDTVTFLLQVSNGGTEAVTLEFSSGQRYDFAVRDSAGSEVWRWSAPQTFMQAVGTEEVEAGGVLEYEERWMAGDRSGEYEAFGEVVSTTHPVELTTPFALGEGSGR